MLYELTTASATNLLIRPPPEHSPVTTGFGCHHRIKKGTTTANHWNDNKTTTNNPSWLFQYNNLNPGHGSNDNNDNNDKTASSQCSLASSLVAKASRLLIFGCAIKIVCANRVCLGSSCHVDCCYYFVVYAVVVGVDVAAAAITVLVIIFANFNCHDCYHLCHCYRLCCSSLSALTFKVMLVSARPRYLLVALDSNSSDNNI